MEHTFIFIKEKLRCAKTLVKTYLGIIYERYTNFPDDTVIIQGLVGRGTGYNDNGKSIYFTNLESIEKYEKLWESNFEDRTVKWASKTTKFNKETNLISKGTFNDLTLINNKSKNTKNTKNPIYKIFDKVEDAIEYIRTKFGPRYKPRKKKKSKLKKVNIKDIILML